MQNFVHLRVYEICSDTQLAERASCPAAYEEGSVMVTVSVSVPGYGANGNTIPDAWVRLKAVFARM